MAQEKSRTAAASRRAEHPSRSLALTRNRSRLHRGTRRGTNIAAYQFGRRCAAGADLASGWPQRDGRHRSRLPEADPPGHRPRGNGHGADLSRFALRTSVTQLDTQGHDPLLQIMPLTWVGVAGFEPTTSSSRTKRATKLRHTPRPSQSLPDPSSSLGHRVPWAALAPRELWDRLRWPRRPSRRGCKCDQSSFGPAGEANRRKW